jgi:hypothetical protein
LPGTIYLESVDPSFGSVYQAVLPADETEAVELAEDGALRSHPVAPALEGPRELAFVDGVRRSEAWLYRELADRGASARGLAGAFGVGCVRVEPGDRLAFGEHRIGRLLIWGSGADADTTLPESAAGWRWQAVSIPDVEPDAPLHELQHRMRVAEAELAEDLARSQVLTVLDGTLLLVRSSDLPIVGYVKTHHRALLAPEDHVRVPRLRAGERTTLFRLHRQGQRGRPYSCYFRLAAAAPMATPWSGVVRLEVPESGGLEQARRRVDDVAAALRPFAGAPHRDPRAPQNLQPIGALETRLRHLLGSPALAARAVRDAVARLHRDALAAAAGDAGGADDAPGRAVATASARGGAVS